MMKLSVIAATLLLGYSLASAQDPAQKSTTRVIVEDGKELVVTGCLSRSENGEFRLTHAAGKEGAVGNYLLARSDDEDDELAELERHVGHRIEVKGRAADRGDGRIKVETERESRTPDGDTARTKSKSQVEGNLAGLPYLGVESFRVLASVCP